MTVFASNPADPAADWRTYFEHAAVSDIGLRRSNNQDSLTVDLAKNAEIWSRRGHLFMVADGMGAHAAGELASKMACDTVPLSSEKLGDEPPPEAIRKAIEDANNRIHSRGQANLDFRGMGTTTSVLLLLPQGSLVAHVGDSRVYRLRDNRIEQLTFDHSLVWELTASDRSRGPTVQSNIPKNIITRSLGPSPHVEVDLEGPAPVAVGDTFLLCSDGLSGQVSDEEIGVILGAFAPRQSAQVLVDLANLRGGPDNISVIVVRVTRRPPEATVRWPVPTVAARRPIHPAIWAGAGSLLLATVLLAIAHYAAVAVVTGLATLLTIVTAVVRGLSGGVAGMEGQRFGRGPYVTRACLLNNEFVDKLAKVVTQLREAATDENWTINWERFNEFDARALAAAERKDYGGAIQEYGSAISFMMEEIRGQRRKKGEKEKDEG
jgi:PPM family protein phosphatase